MNLSTANKPQLLQIALHESCSLALKYAACRELQRRIKRAAKHRVNQTWWSMHGQIKSDIEKLRHKVLQLRDEMVASGATEQQAREYLDTKIFKRINRRIQNSSSGRARKHVNRKSSKSN